MSNRASRDRKEGRRSWRYAKSSSNATGSRKPYLVFLTVLLLGLIGVFIWLFWEPPTRKAFLAVVEVPDSGRVARSPFTADDVQRLLALESLRTLEPWSDVRDDQDFGRERIGERTRDLLREPGDNLILYINTPGISDEGKAYLTHSDYLAVDAGSGGRHEVSDLLSTLADTGGSVKLIVLDSASVDIDPRLGMVVNEFARLVEAEVKKLDQDSNLFVLLPAAPFQVSTTAYGDRQSLFGKYLVDGLAGAADQDGSLYVTLGELYEYVRVGCSTSIDASLDVQQTPVLLQAGVGYVPPSSSFDTEQFWLATLTGKEKQAADEPAEPADAGEGDAKEGEENTDEPNDQVTMRLRAGGRGLAMAFVQATAEKQEDPASEDGGAKSDAKDDEPKKEQPADGGEEKSKEAPAEKPDEKASAEPAAPPPPAELTPQEELLALLQEAWQSRDAVQDPETHEVTPATFAPHLWRALETDLLLTERQVLADPVFDRAKAETAEDDEATPVQPDSRTVEKLEDLINTLTSLDAAVSAQRAVRSPDIDGSIRARLLEAWDGYLDQQREADARFVRREAPQVVELRDQARDADLLIYSLANYVRWHARAHQSLSNQSNQHRRLTDYLQATVDLATTLSSLRKLDELGYQEQHRLEQVDTQLSRALSLRSALESALWEGEDRGNPIVAERLLATPLLDAERRMELVRSLVEATPGLPHEGRVPDARPDLSASSEQWKRLYSHCELELVLARLALGEEHETVKSIDEELTKAEQLTNGDDSEALWKAYRGIGSLFGKYFEDLPHAIREGQAADYALHLVDYRDVDNPENNTLDDHLPEPLRLPYEPDVKVVISAEQNRKRFDLKQGEPYKLVLTIRATREKDASEPLKVADVSALLDVVRQPPTPPQKRSGWWEQTVSYEVSAKPGITQVPGRERAEFTVWSDASAELDERLTLSFTLPREDQISLEVLRPASESQRVQTEHDVDSLSLELLPNLAKPLVSEFQFRARNESSEPKTIEAELFLVKQGRAVHQQHGIISQARRRELFRTAAQSLALSQLESVAKADPVEIPVDGFAVLAFKAPGPAPPAEPPAEGAAATPASPPPAKDASYGMVCVLRDDSDKSWIKWIELAPIPLQRYLEANAWYESGQVVVEVTGKRDLHGNFPAGGLELAWDTRPDFPDGTKRSTEGTISNVDEPTTLYIDIEPDDITREVFIAVNGCPRVLSFQVPCRESAERVRGTPTPNRLSIAVTKLSVPGTDQVFHVPTRAIGRSENIYLDGPLAGEKPPKTDVFLERKQPVILKPVEAMRIHFHLDAPAAGFRPTDGDSVEVLLDGNSQGVTYADRHLRTDWQGLGDNGVVQLALKMEEQFVEIQPSDRDERLSLVAELTFDQQRKSSQAISVVFDGTPPVVREVDVPGQLDLESKQLVEMEVEELSGVSEVRYWLTATRQQSVEKPAIATLVGSETRGKRLRIRFNVDTAGMEEGDYFLGIQVDDRVGLSSRTHQTPIQIKKKKPVPVIATISGTIQFAVRTDYLYTVVALIKGEKPVPGYIIKEPKRGQFVFKDVPAGEYIVRAELMKSGKTKTAEKAVQVKKPGQLKVDLSLK